MRILNFGSLNIDYVYRVDSFVLPGETKSSKSLMINCGGKGLNQSIAAAKAGNTVLHAALLGSDGDMLCSALKDNGVDVSLMQSSNEVSGHAIIQVDDAGQNCILLHGGTNQMFTKEYIDSTLDSFGSDGIVLLQNETNLVGYIIDKAHERGLQVALNAAPMNDTVLTYPLDKLTWLIVNEIEGACLAGCGSDDDILSALRERYPSCNILLTLGKRGAVCYRDGETTTMGSFNVNAVDTTAAGDTFTGYFLYGMLNNMDTAETLKLAAAASALCVCKPGASSSVPLMIEVQQALKRGELGEVSKWK